MKKLLLCLVLVLSVTGHAAVMHIDGLLDLEWKGGNLRLTIYDSTQDPRWAPLVQEAVMLWDQSTAFELQYIKIANDADHPSSTKNAIYVRENDTGAEASTTPNNSGGVSFWVVYLAHPTVYDWALDPMWFPRDPTWFMRRTIRHELGHTLTIGHHNVGPFPANWPWGEAAEPDCAMSNGNEVTAFDLSLLCQRYVCR